MMDDDCLFRRQELKGGGEVVYSTPVLSVIICFHLLVIVRRLVIVIVRCLVIVIVRRLVIVIVRRLVI